MKTLSMLLALSILTAAFSPTYAVWPENGMPLSNVASGVYVYAVAGDGANGCIVAWSDDRNGNSDIFAQRFDAAGNPQWGANGVVVCSEIGSQGVPYIVADDAGGAFVVWLDQRGGAGNDIYAQRVQSDGSMAWQANGRPVCTAGASQQMSLYGEGGSVLIAWEDFRNLVDNDVYAQRLDGSGNPVWAVNGVAVAALVQDQETPSIVSDGAGGAYVAWSDFRSTTDFDAYIQYINFIGNPTWSTNGNLLGGGADDETLPGLVSDGQGGVIAVWEDGTSGLSSIRARRLDPSGADVWSGTRALALSAAFPGGLIVASDGAGGAIAVWVDFLGGVDIDVYANRITAAGMRMWGQDGIPVTSAVNTQIALLLVPDGQGGAVVMWADERTQVSQPDLYVQHMQGNGLPAWTPDGVLIATGPGSLGQDITPGARAADGATFVAYQAFTGDTQSFVQRIEPRYGYWGRPEPVILSVADNPGDQGGQVVVGWSASERDNLEQQEITHYSLWRATDTLPGSSAGSVSSEGGRAIDGDIRRVKLSEIGPDFASAAVREETIAGVEYLWEFVTTQQAIYAAGYSDLVATRQDSTGGGPAQHYFQVVAHTADGQVFFPSAPDSGHSVDNLSPAAPLSLAAQRAGGDNVDLEWSPSGMNETDFKEYWIYRGATSGFPTDPPFFLSSTPDTMSTDTGASSGSTWYYKVVAVDIHDNPSDDSNEAFVSPVTGIGDRTPALTSLTVQNYPNPFSGVTEIRIGLPAAAPVVVEIYDVAGRRVAGRSLGTLTAGFQSVTFDGRDASGQLLPSGVYFYRVTAANETATRKIVIRR